MIYIYIYILIHTHTHTHTHIYIYIYLTIHAALRMPGSKPFRMKKNTDILLLICLYY